MPGAAILLAGEPGVGKSTLLLEVAAQTARYQRRTLYVTGEESAAQVRLRADRTGGVHDELYLAAETDLGAVLTHIEEVRPELLVVDSVQTIGAADVDGVPGGVTQVKEVAAALIRVAKTRNITTVLVGHVTKDGSIAGPRVLEHLVDVVLHFEGDRNSRFRMVRAMKNRFGPIDEVGCFDLSAEGIVAVTDPTGLFVETHHQQVPGTCVAVTMEGRRPLLAEVQALVTPHRGRAAAPYDGRARLRPGWRWCSPCSSSTAGSACTATTCSPPRSAAPGWSSPRPTWPSRSRSPRPRAPPGAPGHRRVRRDRPRRRAPPGPRPAPAARRGCPARLPGRARPRRPRAVEPGRRERRVDGMQVIDVPDVASALRLRRALPACPADDAGCRAARDLLH